MTVFVPDDKNVVGLGIVISVKFGRNQCIEFFLYRVHILTHANLAMIDVSAAAAGFDGKLVVVRQVLGCGYSAAALGIIAGQGNQIDINHCLFQFIAAGNVLRIAVGIGHQPGQMFHLILKGQKQIRAFFIDNADANAQHIFGIDLYPQIIQH